MEHTKLLKNDNQTYYYNYDEMINIEPFVHPNPKRNIFQLLLVFFIIIIIIKK